MTIAIKPTASGSTIEQDGSTILTVDGSGNISTPNTFTSTGAITGTGGIYLGGTDSANLLDDYEVGTYTPVLTEDTNTLTTNSSAGHYIKIGRLVWARFNFGNITQSGTGYLRASLPFIVDQNAYSGGVQMQRFTYATSDRSPFMLAINNTSQVGFYWNLTGNNNSTTIIASDMANATNSDILGTIIYMTD